MQDSRHHRAVAVGQFYINMSSRLLESVKEALELFKIDDAVLVEEVRSQPRKLSKQRKKTVKGLEDGATKFDTIQDVDKYKDNNESKAKDSVAFKNVIIVCPYEGWMPEEAKRKGFILETLVLNSS